MNCAQKIYICKVEFISKNLLLLKWVFVVVKGYTYALLAINNCSFLVWSIFRCFCCISDNKDCRVIEGRTD